MARGLFFASVVFAFLLAYLAQLAGSAIIIGSFAAGLVDEAPDRGAYSAVTVMVMITTFVAPPLLRRLLEQKTPGNLDSGAADIVMDAPMDQQPRHPERSEGSQTS